MQFLQKYVQEHLEWQPKQVKLAYLEMQKGYRFGQQVGYKNIAQIQAYVFARFPATYSVCLKLIEQHFAQLPIRSILDWGCGIGTASLASGKIFKTLEYFLFEQDDQAKSYANQFLKHFFPANSVHTVAPTEIDLSIFSYSLGEVERWQKILDEVWPKTKYLLIIEPGTPAHYKRLLQVRDYMLSKDAYLLAPCCHRKKCPLNEDDWCHFTVNVARSKEHRFLKGAARGFEQEAYSYLIFAKQEIILDSARLVAQPRLHGGHMQLKICTNDGEIATPTIGRSSENYKKLKKLQWGESIDKWPLDENF